MSTRRTSRPFSFAPSDPPREPVRRAYQSLLSRGWKVVHSHDPAPDFGHQTLVRPLSDMTKMAVLAIDRGLVHGVTYHPKQRSLVFSAVGLRGLYEVMSEVAWPDRFFPKRAIAEAQEEVVLLLQPFKRLPDFALSPKVHANPVKRPVKYPPFPKPERYAVDCPRPTPCGICPICAARHSELLLAAGRAAHEPWMTRKPARGVRRNASCPSCGSSDYYEGLMGPDCAKPSCVHYHGGAATSVAPPGRSAAPASPGRSSRAAGRASSSFVLGYVMAALGSSTDDNGDPLDKHHQSGDIANDTMEQMVRDCGRFYVKSLSLWDGELSDEEAGHDFWLSRNNHGSGFFDEEELPDPAMRKLLQDAARKFGSFDLIVGDDGQIHGSPLDP